MSGYISNVEAPLVLSLLKYALFASPKDNLHVP